MAGYALRENTGEGALSVDNLKIGTTFAEVAGGGSASRPPAIISGPQHQTVTNGADVVFSVTATGTPPLAYQWQFTPTSESGFMAPICPGR